MKKSNEEIFLFVISMLLILVIIVNFDIISKSKTELSNLEEKIEMLQNENITLEERLSYNRQKVVTLSNHLNDANQRCLELIEDIDDVLISQVSSHKVISDNEVSILCRIVEAEATGGSVEQKRNVAHNILARVKSDMFPNDVEGVVFQKNYNENTEKWIYQYSPIYDKRYWSVQITDSTIEAVYQALSGVESHNYLFFRAESGCDDNGVAFFNTRSVGMYDGIHYFYD